MKLGIVCGLQSEKAALGPVGHPVAVSGADPTRAYEGACRLAAAGARALVSVGLAGALAPGLQPGDLLLPDEVIEAGGQVFRPRTITASTAARGPLFGSDLLVTGGAEKARLANLTGAVAVDMESHAVARVARNRGLPLFVIRAIADPADQVLPPSAAHAVRPDGSVDTLRTVMGLLGRPGDLPQLVALGRQASRGLETLRNEGRALLADIARA